MCKVLSLALFGDATRKDGSGMNYHAYLSSGILAAANLFPADEGWQIYMHVDPVTLEGPYGSTLVKMAKANLIVLKSMGEAVLTRAMLWRMAPVFELGVDYVFARDIDCISMPRDRAICDVFIASGAVAGTAHDSLSHTGILGGLCGFHAPTFRKATGLNTLEDLYKFAATSNDAWARHGTDQVVLNRLIDRPNGPVLLEHRYNGWHTGPNTYPPRRAGEYLTKSYSTPVPDKGKCKLAPELREEADRLANHLGAAGYDLVKARKFWEMYGDSKITQLVTECERSN